MGSTGLLDRAMRGDRLVVQVVSLKCRCRTVRKALIPNVSDLRGPRDHEIRCYQCGSVLGIWLTSTGDR